MEWIQLTESAKIEELLKDSLTSQIVLFKHSTSCGISRMVLKNFEREVAKLSIDNTSFYFIDLIAYRDVSNEIAKELEIRHESPQLIILKDGRVKHHSSHSDISAEATQSTVLDN